MNRDDFRRLAELRLREARALLQARHFDGAYYLGGYVIENALKACIAKQTKRFEFPDRKTVNESHTHNLEQLLRVAGLQPELEREAASSRAFEVNWTVVKDWSEESRYQRHTRQEAEDLFNAITDPQNGVLPWIRQRW